jgi:hypothetical protein
LDGCKGNSQLRIVRVCSADKDSSIKSFQLPENRSISTGQQHSPFRAIDNPVPKDSYSRRKPKTGLQTEWRFQVASWKQMSGKIFINYRREDSSAWAGRLSDHLSAHFPQSQIFMDVDMDLGINFVEEIEKNVGSCDVLIAVIGKRWLISTDEKRRRRLGNPNDFVRLEIATALKRNIRVIPVLVDGASMPPSSQLPEDLKPLVLRNALNVSHERFRADAERLIGGIGRALESVRVEQQRKREEQERLAAEQREREEKERLELERREVEKNARLEAERRQREKQDRLETEQRQHEEKEQLEHDAQSPPPGPVAPAISSTKPGADKPSAGTPKVSYPLESKPGKPEHKKLTPPSLDGTAGKSPSRQLVAFLAIVAVLVVGGLIYLATRASKSPPRQSAPIAAVTPSPPAIATQTVEGKAPLTPQAAVQPSKMTTQRLSELVQAAAAGDNDAMFELGWRYEHGSGGADRDYDKARLWYKKAADAGNVEAWMAKDRVRSAMPEATQPYATPEATQPYATPEATQLYAPSKMTTQRLSKLVQAAAAGDNDAMFELGWRYEHGSGGADRDYDKARLWYKKAADAGNVEAWMAKDRVRPK